MIVCMVRHPQPTGGICTTILLSVKQLSASRISRTQQMLSTIKLSANNPLCHSPSSDTQWLFSKSLFHLCTFEKHRYSSLYTFALILCEFLQPSAPSQLKNKSLHTTRAWRTHTDSYMFTAFVLTFLVIRFVYDLWQCVQNLKYFISLAIHIFQSTRFISKVMHTVARSRLNAR